MARILVINDEADLTEVSEMVLKDAGYETSSLTDGRRAVETARAFRPNLIVLDWNLTGMNADWVLQRLRQEPETSTVPVLLMSGAEEAEAQGRRYGVDGFLKKPFGAEALVGAVGEILARTPAGGKRSADRDEARFDVK